MTFIFDPSVPVGVDRPWLNEEQSLATRVRIVLETRPGQIPWRPEFGCDLEGLVGQSANGQLLSQARWRVQSALARWLPDATIDAVRVSAAQVADGLRMTGHREVPLAEAALLTMGVQAALHVDVELTGPAGPVAFSTTIEP